LTDLLRTIYDVNTPILLGLALGALYGHYFKPDVRQLSRLCIYLLGPCLAFEGIINADISGAGLAQIAMLAFLGSAAMAVIGLGLARSLRLDRRREGGFMMCVVCYNTGTYGIPFNEFAFGLAGRQIAVVYFTMMLLVTNTLGVFLASRGSGKSLVAGLVNVARLPTVYAAVIGLILNFSGVSLVTDTNGLASGSWTVPLPLARTIHLLAAASIPVMLVQLGAQLEQSRFTIRRLRWVLLASFTTLLIAPLVAAALSIPLGLTGLYRQVGILQFGMPTAILAGIFATEFGSDSEFVTSVIMVSTFASVLTLSLLLQFV